MTEVIENTLSIEVKNTLSFVFDVQPKIDELQEELKEMIDNNELSDVDNVQKFVDYNLVIEDKVAILNKIKSEYDYENSFSEASIFDEGVIENGIYEWVEEQFNFNVFETFSQSQSNVLLLVK